MSVRSDRGPALSLGPLQTVTEVHAGVTLWLNGGVPAAEVARRAGHGVGALLKVYTGCIDGEDDAVNTRITKALRASRKRGDGRGSNQ